MKRITLVIIPILIMLVGIGLGRRAGPWYLGSNSDPEYVYLLNGYNIALGKAPGFYAHPGVPLQLLMAGVIGRNEDVLVKPEEYLNNAYYLILIALIISVYCIGYLTFNLTKKYSSAILIQSGIFLSYTAPLVLHRVSPEPLLLIAAWFYGYMILAAYYNKIISVKFIIVISVITATAIALRITAFPLIIPPMIFLKGKNKLRFLTLTTVMTAVWLLPIFNLWGPALRWYYQLFIHANNYGFGDTTVINLNSLVSNLGQIVIHEGFLILTLISGIILYFNTRNKIILGLCICLMMQIFLSGKSYNLRYLIPGLGLLGSVGVIWTDSIKNKKLLWGFWGILVFFGLINITNTLLFLNTINPNWSEAEKLNKFKPGVKVVEYYGASTPEYALTFGNDYANNNYSEQIKKLFPDKYFLDIRNGKFSANSEDKIYIRGVPFSDNYAVYKPKLNLTDVYQGSTETLYEVNGVFNN